MRLAYSMAAAIGLLYGCSSYTDGLSDLPASTQATSTQPVPEGQAAIVSGNTAFAVDLYKTLRVTHAGQNLFVSPASISTAFGLAYAGARGETEREIADVLRFDRLPTEALHPAMGGLLSGLEVNASVGEGERKREARLSINNALWVDEQTVLEEPYAALIAKHYGATDFRVDYRGNPDAARKKINAWVEDKTEDRIKDLLAESHVKDTTRSILVNTIYMKANWLTPFYEAATSNEDFQRLDGTNAKVPMMQVTEDFKHWQNGRLQILEMPYYGDLSMVVLLPKRKGDLSALEDALSDNALQGWVASLATSPAVEVDLKFPKLKLETKYEMKIDGILPMMGMSIPFSDAADFSGAVRKERQPDGYDLKIEEVVHQTFLEVDESGTEAAGVTAVGSIIVTSAQLGPPPPPPIPFYADHPFLFLIKDNKTGMILFMGRMLEPESA